MLAYSVKKLMAELCSVSSDATLPVAITKVTFLNVNRSFRTTHRHLMSHWTALYLSAGLDLVACQSITFFMT